jgi:hypothetical protein
MHTPAVLRGSEDLRGHKEHSSGDANRFRKTGSEAGVDPRCQQHGVLRDRETHDSLPFGGRGFERVLGYGPDRSRFKE